MSPPRRKRSADAERIAQRRASLRERGLCPTCGDRPESDTECDVCKLKNRQRVARHRLARAKLCHAAV